MTKIELKRTYFGYGKVFAHSLKASDSYGQRWALAMERVNRFLTTIPDATIELKEELIDSFMLGVAQTLDKS